jgi:PPK2 family polyphosphate:nucleotide phosphotransferase
MKKTNDKFWIKEDSKFKLKEFDPSYVDGFKDEESAKEMMHDDIKKLIKLQEKLFASNQFSVLIILQAMDAAGKDGVIKHVMSGLNPQGCNVKSFKHPTDEDYEHDYFWRFNKALPESGNIGIFNRSYYENVLICRVHPEYILDERLPKYDTVKKLDDDFWEHRFKQINRFEKNLVQNGTVILKFFLHVSKEEQRKRLLDRIDLKEKNWKFSFADINERKYWDEYQTCYEEAIKKTSTEEAPWYVIPADIKWFTRATIANILVEKLEELDLKFPQLPKAEIEKLESAKVSLLKEN